jgi:hypothetical protein
MDQEMGGTSASGESRSHRPYRRTSARTNTHLVHAPVKPITAADLATADKSGLEAGLFLGPSVDPGASGGNGTGNFRTDEPDSGMEQSHTRSNVGATPDDTSGTTRHSGGISAERAGLCPYPFPSQIWLKGMRCGGRARHTTNRPPTTPRAKAWAKLMARVGMVSKCVSA